MPVCVCECVGQCARVCVSTCRNADCGQEADWNSVCGQWNEGVQVTEPVQACTWACDTWPCWYLCAGKSSWCTGECARGREKIELIPMLLAFGPWLQSGCTSAPKVTTSNFHLIQLQQDPASYFYWEWLEKQAASNYVVLYWGMQSRQI